MKLNERGLLVVLSGPSGVGKGTVREALFRMKGHDLIYSVSMTTRAPREGEIEGKEYFFTSRADFEEGIKNNRFLEYAEFVGNYYGTPLANVDTLLGEGHEVVLEIEVNGALQVREKMKDAIFIFIAPPSMEELFMRLRSRGTEDVSIVEERIEKAKREIELAYLYDYIVVNDTVENAADKIMAIIRAEHAKTERTIATYRKMLIDNEEV